VAQAALQVRLPARLPEVQVVLLQVLPELEA